MKGTGQLNFTKHGSANCSKKENIGESSKPYANWNYVKSSVSVKR